MQDKTGPACGKVPFVQLFYPPRHISDGERNEKGVRDLAPGAIVKQIRSSTGLSQRSFAESIGICQSAVGYYESGKHRVSDVIWEKIKSVYHDVIVQLAIPEEIPELSKKELPPQSEKLRRIRCASGLSQREFAESIGVSKSTIGNCEIGMQEISDQIWARIKEKYPHHDHHNQNDDCGDVCDQDVVRDDGRLIAESGTPAIIIQSQDGREINPEEIIDRVGHALISLLSCTAHVADHVRIT